MAITALLSLFATQGKALAQSVYSDGGGTVSLEAEDGTTIARNGEQWVPSTAAWGYSGSGFLLSSPSVGTIYDTNYAGTAPEVDFKVDFQTIGTYYVWIRGAGSAAHVGLDGAAVATASRIAGLSGGWTWSNTRMDGTRATITVSSAGVHTVNVWMWSDTLWLDKVLLVNSSGYTPSGTGPAENSIESTGTVTSSGTGTEGAISLMKFTSSAYDSYIMSPSTSLQQFQLQHLQRMVVFSPAFDASTSWYPNGLIYVDAYAAYVGGTTFGEAIQYTHPDWILKDQYGNNLYIPFACANGSCSQYAADFSNAGFRNWWVSKVRALLSAGNYKGIYIDDVNMDFRVGDNWGNFVTPWDKNTNSLMTQANWRLYMAQFMEFVRQNLPGYEICHNAIWFAGGDDGRDADPYIHRQIMAADDINIEYGINDNGLTGGTGSWSADAVLAYAERLNGLGKHPIIAGIGSGTPGNWPMYEYGVAGYLLINNGGAYSGDSFNMVIDPNNWWAGFNVNLGGATGGRYSWNGLQRRDFTAGMVLLNYPGNPAITVTLPGSYARVDGTVVTSITLQAKQAAILTRNGPVAVPDFSIAVSPSSQSVATGGSVAYTVSVSPLNGFSGTVSLAAGGLPGGSSASFSPASIAGSGTSTFTMNMAGAAAGTTNFTVAGTSGSTSHSATASVTVTGASSTQPAAIGINFVGRGNAMASSESAGVIAKANWNNAAGTSSSMSLVNEYGAATGATVSWSSDTTWLLPLTDAPGNKRMMIGYIDTVGNTKTTVTVSGLPASSTGYDVYAYTDGDNGGVTQVGSYQISGLTAVSATNAANSTFSGTFTQASNSAGNYVKFTVSGTSFTLTATPVSSTGAYLRAPVNGIQIVPGGTTSAPKSIGVNFAGASTTPMASGEVAGVVAKANWNNAVGAVSGSPLALVDETGVASGATVTWSSDLVWQTGITDVAGNNRLMRGYLDTVNNTTTTITVGGLPADANGYDLYVYTDGDNGGYTRVSAYQLSGPSVTTQSYNATDAANTNFSGTFIGTTGGAGNYVKFLVTGTSFTLKAIPVSSQSPYLRAPVNAIQMVPR